MNEDGGGLLAVFEQLDYRNNKFLDVDALHSGLTKLGVDISRSETALFLDTVDDNGDRKISFMEFSRTMAECDDGKTINDPSHHLFPLFDDIRRRA